MNPKNRPFSAFVLTIVVLGIASWLYTAYWPFQQNGAAGGNLMADDNTFSQAEMDRLLAEWPKAFQAGQAEIARLRATGSTIVDERTIIDVRKAEYFTQIGWDAARADYLFRYFVTLRNALDKGTLRHEQLIFFKDQYEQNEGVGDDLRAAQLRQVTQVLEQIETAPALETLPVADVELMRLNYDRFHFMMLSLVPAEPGSMVR